MAVKIRLKRMGKIRAPYYRIVVADSRTKRDGRVIEEIGKYHPKEDPSFIEVDSDRALYWLGVGAQPSEPVAAILKVTGDWQKFTGQAAPPPMLVAEPRRDKTEMFNEALKDSKHDPSAEAVTPRRQAAKKSPVEELKDLSDSEAGTAADTAAVEDAVTEAASSVAETAPLGSEDAAETAQEQDAPNGEMGSPDGASEALDGASDAPDGASDPNAAQTATADETDPAES